MSTREQGVFFLPGDRGTTDSAAEFDAAWYDDLFDPILNRLGWQVQGFSERSVAFYTEPSRTNVISMPLRVVQQIAELCCEGEN